MGLRLRLEWMGFRFNGMDDSTDIQFCQQQQTFRYSTSSAAAFFRSATSTSTAVASTYTGIVFVLCRPSIGTRNLPSFSGNCSNKQMDFSLYSQLLFSGVVFFFFFSFFFFIMARHVCVFVSGSNVDVRVTPLFLLHLLSSLHSGKSLPMRLWVEMKTKSCIDIS